jgi:hypothetical protein
MLFLNKNVFQDDNILLKNHKNPFEVHEKQVSGKHLYQLNNTYLFLNKFDLIN